LRFRVRVTQTLSPLTLILSPRGGEEFLVVPIGMK
jgi:hypothetical protein